MKSINRVVVLLLVMIVTVKAYGKVEHIIIVPGCLDKTDFERKYGEKSFESLDSRKNKIQLIKEDLKSTFKTVNLDSFSLDKSLVKVVSQYTHLDYEKIASEINLLKEFSELGIIPDYKDCAYKVELIRKEYRVRYFIIQEKVDRDVYTFFRERLSRKLKTSEMIYKFLQMAMLIQKLRLLGYTHQDIKPSNFVSTNQKMSDFRLIDLSFAVPHNSPGIGGTRYFSSPDKRSLKFTATFHQDAFAFALTLIKLIDEEGVFDKTIKKECIRHPDTFSDKCKESFIAGVEALKGKVELKGFFEYLKDHFFNTEDPLDINDMMAVLINCFKKINDSIPDNSRDKNYKLIDLVNKLITEYNENIQTLNEEVSYKLQEKKESEGTSPNIII